MKIIRFLHMQYRFQFHIGSIKTRQIILARDYRIKDLLDGEKLFRRGLGRRVLVVSNRREGDDVGYLIVVQGLLLPEHLLIALFLSRFASLFRWATTNYSKLLVAPRSCPRISLLNQRWSRAL
jgi:hypothetical protein